MQLSEIIEQNLQKVKKTVGDIERKGTEVTKKA